jgi:hypothetical protein
MYRWINLAGEDRGFACGDLRGNWGEWDGRMNLAWSFVGLSSREEKLEKAPMM